VQGTGSGCHREPGTARAGFGKTTLLAEWLANTATDDRSVAWLSLEESDSQPASFWTHVIMALLR
jgi:LuxR family maltose regulon positive regulatory protein